MSPDAASLVRADGPAVLVSACLLGEPVRYDGTDNATGDAVLEAWRRAGRVVPFCPEVAGGLGTPRPPAEIRGGTGGDVLDGEARVVTDEGRDVTEAYLAGARAALAAAREADVAAAILKARSPSCGSEAIYDGSFDGSVRPGRGVAAALLERWAVRVFTEHQLAAAHDYVES